MDNEKKIEDLLKEREKIDQKLKDKYYRSITVMFTDLKDATSFVEKRGDIEGRAWIERHNKLIFPIIEDCQGRIIKTNFDEIMASFHSPIEAVEAAIKIQQRLKEHNKDLPLADQFRVRIGINTGKALVEEGDIIGDAVNTAKRVESMALADQILVSEATHEEIKDLFPWKSLGPRPLKGKSEELKIFEIISEERKPILRGKSGKGEGVFIIEASLEEKKLIISSYDKPYQEEKTLRLYQEKELSIEDLNLQCKEILNLLIQANRPDGPGKGVKERLKEEGERLYNRIFTPKIKEMLRSTRADHLILDIDDKLVQIPWELCFDGEDFLCRKYNMGRVVRTRQETSHVRYREIAGPLRMIILSNPTGDLKATQKEVAIIQKELAGGQIKVDLKHGNVDIAYVQKALSRYDLIHYAGHADYDLDNPSNSAWILKDGRLKASSILEMVGGMQTLPSFIFSNACQSGQTEPWNVEKSYTMIYGLANAFLLSGVRHYIGTFWEVQDEMSSEYAVEFYKELAQGSTIGEAVRKARVELTQKYSEDHLAWASYMLYGDPTYGYLKAQGKDPGLEAKAMERKLTAILSADVKGYSRLMGEDEEATVRTLTAYRQVMASLIQQHRGGVVDSPGDNLLAEFASVVDAVRCAVEIQRELKARNAGLPGARRMEFRIGVNLGDVLVEGGRLYGEGVNIAARLEGLAEPGGLCISGMVHDQVKNKLSLEYDDLGEQEVKNIADPVRVYRVVGELRAEASSAMLTTGAPQAGPGQSPGPAKQVRSRSRLRAEPEEARLDPPRAGMRGRRFRYPALALLLAFLLFAFSMLFPTLRAYLQTVIQQNKTEIAIRQEDLEKKRAEKDKREWEEIHKLADDLNKLK